MFEPQHEKRALIADVDNKGPGQPAHLCNLIHQIKMVARYIFFLSLHENICCGYSFEVSWQEASIGYLKHMFS